MNIRIKVFVSTIFMALIVNPVLGATKIKVSDLPSINSLCKKSSPFQFPSDYLPNEKVNKVYPKNYANFSVYTCPKGVVYPTAVTIIEHTSCKDGYNKCDFEFDLLSYKITTTICSPSCTCGAGSYFWSNKQVISGGITLGTTPVTQGPSAINTASASDAGGVVAPGTQIEGCDPCGSLDGIAAISYFGDNKGSSSCFVPAGSDSVGQFVWDGTNANSDGACEYK